MTCNSATSTCNISFKITVLSVSRCRGRFSTNELHNSFSLTLKLYGFSNSISIIIRFDYISKPLFFFPPLFLSLSLHWFLLVFCYPQCEDAEALTSVHWLKFEIFVVSFLVFYFDFLLPSLISCELQNKTQWTVGNRRHFRWFTTKWWIIISNSIKKKKTIWNVFEKSLSSNLGSILIR